MPRQNKIGAGDLVGKYQVGSFIGEEWIYYRKYTHREESCVAREPTCVLEIDVESYEAIRSALLECGLGKDVSMLETQLKRSFNVKKARGMRF